MGTEGAVGGGSAYDPNTYLLACAQAINGGGSAAAPSSTSAGPSTNALSQYTSDLKAVTQDNAQYLNAVQSHNPDAAATYGREAVSSLQDADTQFGHLTPDQQQDLMQAVCDHPETAKTGATDGNGSPVGLIALTPAAKAALHNANYNTNNDLMNAQDSVLAVSREHAPNTIADPFQDIL